MNKIRIYCTSDGYMAEYLGPHSNDVAALFGTTIIPTAFTAQAFPEKVLATIQRLNPEVTVEFRSLVD